MPAFYRRAIFDFLSDSVDEIIGRLTSSAAKAGFFQLAHAQTVAWEAEIGTLKACAKQLVSKFNAETWQILLEYPTPRRGKRIDAVLIAWNVLLVLEFKNGVCDFNGDAVAQVEDYCLDLADFHKESYGRSIVPNVVASLSVRSRRPGRTHVNGSALSQEFPGLAKRLPA
jgi:hypothetical protein